MSKQWRSADSGFTLIELLVVMGILMFLFGLGIAILPAIYQRWEVSKGAQLVQGALARARQEARRSGRPTGVRLTATAGSVQDLKLIQQPVDGSGAGGYFVPEGAGLPNLAGGPGFVRVGDPQIMYGEREIMLPEKVGIDMALSNITGRDPPTPIPQTGTEPAPSNAPYWDIVFSPGGGITSNRWGTDKLILWVRDVSITNPTRGYPTLVCIYVRTGHVAAHPVDISGVPDPNNNNAPNRYAFCNNPKTSGL
jgi:type II secretory pathway pseudopilin PulG